MRTPTDVLLSLQRHVARVLPEPWMVVTELEDERPERPYAVVAFDGEPESDGLISSPEMVVPVTVYAYPSPSASDGTPLTRAQTARNAEAIAEDLWRLVALGEDRDGPGRPNLLPIFDYSGRDEVQQVTVAGTAGTFRLAHGGPPTTALLRDAQARHLRLALEQLPSIGVGNVWVYGGRTGGPWAVQFIGALAGSDVPALTIDADALTGPDADADIEVLVPGSAEPWRSSVDFARIDRISAGQTGDDSDPRQRTVTLRLRLTWARRGNVPSPEMILKRVIARKL